MMLVELDGAIFKETVIDKKITAVTKMETLD